MSAAPQSESLRALDPPAPDPQTPSPEPKTLGDSQDAPHDQNTPPAPYTVFTKWQCRWINLAAAFAGMFSTLCSYIYFPALDAIAADLGVSVALVNLTVTSYLILAGVAPAVMGDMADRNGRRPVYGAMFALLVGANVGIAVQGDFAALLVLRMVQSAGSSGLIAAAYGVIADITTPGNRGGFVGFQLLLTDVATSLGPVIGGSITASLGWRWIFWFLAILNGSHFLAMLLFFPETQRNIVGDGSGHVSGVYWSLFTLFQSPSIRKNRPVLKRPGGRKFPNPFNAFPILRRKNSLVVVLMYSATYTVKMTLQASLGVQARGIYGLDSLAAGLVYIPSGVASGIGAFGTGRLLNWLHRRAKGRVEADDGAPGHVVTADFPIERVRTPGIYLLTVMGALGTLGYGLALMKKAHISVILILQFITGLTTASTFAMTSTLLTDLNQDRSATAQGALSIVRCLLAGGGIAVMQPIADGIGIAGCFAIYGVLYTAVVPLAWLLRSRGPQWRRALTFPPEQEAR